MLRKIEPAGCGKTPENLRLLRIIPLIFLVIGALVSVYAIRLNWILLRSKSWPVARGEMVSVERNTDSAVVRFTYRYTKDGRQIESSNIMPGSDFHYFPPFPEGAEVSVWYAPGVREYSFIKTPDTILIIVPNVIGFCFLTLGSLASFSLIGRNRAKLG